MEWRTKNKPAHAVLAADRLIKMKETKPVWEVIGEVIKIWADTHPKSWKSYLVHLDETKQTRKSTRGFRGVSKDKNTGAYLNYMADIPEPVLGMIRSLYSPSELPMDKKFFNDFGKKFPIFRVVEKRK